MEEQTYEMLKQLGIIEIENDVKYWLVRTASGSFFKDFYNNNYISIGWDEISNIDFIRNTEEKKFKEKIKEIYPSEERPGYIMGQIKRFVCEIKKGDIILIPSSNSSNIAFGKVTSDEAYIRDNVLKDKGCCQYKKALNVEWIKILSREEFDPYLYRLMTAHNAISNIDNYADFINRILYNVYYRNGILHVTFNVRKNDNITAMEMNDFINNTLEYINEINKQYEMNAKISNINLKISVQSPGPIEFLGEVYDFATENIGGMILLSIVFLMVIGGECKFSSKKEKDEKSLELRTEGVIGRIIEFVKESNKQKNTEKELVLREKNEKFKRSIEKLKIKATMQKQDEKVEK
ncbi:MAG: hypothetical protein IJE59_00195 [Clostridia bacterium]|nr:hypothetical protein [Clostridia bacterium]